MLSRGTFKSLKRTQPNPPNQISGNNIGAKDPVFDPCSALSQHPCIRDRSQDLPDSVDCDVQVESPTIDSMDMVRHTSHQLNKAVMEECLDGYEYPGMGVRATSDTCKAGGSIKFSWNAKKQRECGVSKAPFSCKLFNKDPRTLNDIPMVRSGTFVDRATGEEYATYENDYFPPDTEPRQGPSQKRPGQLDRLFGGLADNKPKFSPSDSINDEFISMYPSETLPWTRHQQPSYIRKVEKIKFDSFLNADGERPDGDEGPIVSDHIPANPNGCFWKPRQMPYMKTVYGGFDTNEYSAPDMAKYNPNLVDKVSAEHRTKVLRPEPKYVGNNPRMFYGNRFQSDDTLVEPEKNSQDDRLHNQSGNDEMDEYHHMKKSIFAPNQQHALPKLHHETPSTMVGTEEKPWSPIVGVVGSSTNSSFSKGFHSGSFSSFHQNSFKEDSATQSLKQKSFGSSDSWARSDNTYAQYHHASLGSRGLMMNTGAMNATNSIGTYQSHKGNGMYSTHWEGAHSSDNTLGKKFQAYVEEEVLGAPNKLGEYHESAVSVDREIEGFTPLSTVHQTHSSEPSRFIHNTNHISKNDVSETSMRETQYGTQQGKEGPAFRQPAEFHEQAIAKNDQRENTFSHRGFDRRRERLNNPTTQFQERSRNSGERELKTPNRLDVMAQYMASHRSKTPMKSIPRDSKYCEE